ncbi:MAG: glycosyltransferase family 39 protein [Bacteroidota bacterium]
MQLRWNRETFLKQWLPAVLFSAAIYFPLFLHLDVEPIKNFDESLFACRAFSVAHYGDYLCNFRDLPYGPSASNTKPPLMTYVQAGFFKLIGYNELALRLPIAIAAVLLIFTLIQFGRKQFGSEAFGYFCGLILVTSRGFVTVHMSRTGDHDVPLALFGLLLLLMVHRYFSAEIQEKKYLGWITLLLICTTLTKGIAGLFFGPAIVLYALYRKQLIPLLKDKYTWYAALTYVVVIAGYYLVRNEICPDFLDRVWRYEVGGHYGATRDGHNHPWFWYLKQWYEFKFHYWLPLIPLGIGLTFHPKFRQIRDLSVLFLLASTTYLAVISNSQTKLSWYDASLYPMMAFWAGLVCFVLWQSIMDWLQANSISKRYLFTALFVLGLFAFPYRDIMEKVYEPKDVLYPPEKYGFLMKQMDKTMPDFQSYQILHVGQSTHSLFYQLVYNEVKGYQIGRYFAYESAKEGDFIMACQNRIKRRLEREFETQVWQSTEQCKLYYLVKRKPIEPKNLTK